MLGAYLNGKKINKMIKLRAKKNENAPPK